MKNSMFTFVTRIGPAVLRFWDNRCYTIDVDGIQKVVMEDTDLADALKRLEEISKNEATETN